MQRLRFVVVLAIVLVVSLPLGLSCAPQAELGISVTELDNGVMVENVAVSIAWFSSIRLKVSSSLN